MGPGRWLETSMSNRKLVSMRGIAVPESAIRKFQAGVRGQLIGPSDHVYELARCARNRVIDRPTQVDRALRRRL
jgi:hypothetical protein